MRRNMMGAVMGAVAAGAVLTACGGGGSGSAAAAVDSSSSSDAGMTSGAEAASGAQPVEVKATDFAFSVPSTHLAPGTYTFQMKDDGHTTHAIEIDGPGVEDKKSSTIGPGGTVSLIVTLKKGDYVLYCPVANHRALGMQTKLTVG